MDIHSRKRFRDFVLCRVLTTPGKNMIQFTVETSRAGNFRSSGQARRQLIVQLIIVDITAGLLDSASFPFSFSL